MDKRGREKFKNIKIWITKKKLARLNVLERNINGCQIRIEMLLKLLDHSNLKIEIRPVSNEDRTQSYGIYEKDIVKSLLLNSIEKEKTEMKKLEDEFNGILK